MTNLLPRRGPIAWMANNSVAANLLMLAIIIGGLMSTCQVKQEVFPEFSLDMIRVTVPYPGASPEEVEQGIVLAIEEAVRGLDGVKRVTSSSAEGSGTVAIELLLDANPDKVLADAKNAVDRVLTFPEDAEEPQVSLASNRQKVISLVIAGDQELASLHAIAEDTRSRMLDHADISQVTIDGIPPLEVSVELPRETLEAHGLSLEQVAAQIRMASLELPGGSVDTEAGEIMVRMSDRRRSGAELADITLRATNGGAAVRLGDVANIIDGYADTDVSAYYDGKRALRVTAYRVGDETPIAVAAAVRTLAEDLTIELGDTITVAVWDDESEILEDRIDLLVRNARVGLILVLLVLALFLDLRLALWVSIGIPVSFLGAILLMPTIDVSINMISLFALIVTLGMVVDDAIVVGENAYTKMQEGKDNLTAAIEGAREMSVPVTFAILTTMAFFAPMFFVPGMMGKIFRILPAMVIAVLIFSLLESFLVLPAHLAHMGREKGPILRTLDRPRQFAAAGLDLFIAKVFTPALRGAVAWRYAVVAGSVSSFLISLGIVVSGLLPFSFFPNLEGDLVTVTATLPYGAPVERTTEVGRTLQASAERAIEASGGDDIVRGTFVRVGEGPDQGFMPRETGAHLVTVELQLVPTGERGFTAEEIAAAWREATPPIAGLESVVFSSSFGPAGGAAVNLQLTHPDEAVLAAASGELVGVLSRYPDLANVQSDYAAGKPQLDFHLLDNARTLNLTGQDVARQLRSAFYGAEALREQRGRNEIKVMVRLPEHQRSSEYDLSQLMVTTPTGNSTPLHTVAQFERGRAPTSIVREEGRRIITVQAELAPGAKSAQSVTQSLNATDIPAILAAHPGLEIGVAGEQREQMEAFSSLGWNSLFATLTCYVLLAIPFRSYTQPIIIMFAIPMGVVGAIGGHLIMQYELSIISLFGMVALSGVVVNDSLVLIDAANRARRDGNTPQEAVQIAARRRLRPIVLTSLTTFFGLAPMILETSVQARFLVPMAISLGFGVLFVTVVVLLVVPAVFMIVEDVVQLSGAAFRWVVHGSTKPRPTSDAAAK